MASSPQWKCSPSKGRMCEHQACAFHCQTLLTFLRTFAAENIKQSDQCRNWCCSWLKEIQQYLIRNYKCTQFFLSTLSNGWPRVNGIVQTICSYVQTCCGMLMSQPSNRCEIFWGSGCINVTQWRLGYRLWSKFSMSQQWGKSRKHIQTQTDVPEQEKNKTVANN